MATDLPQPATLAGLERQLAEAQERLRRTTSLSNHERAGARQRWLSAHRDVLQLERRVAAAKGEPHAMPLNFPVQWDMGAPLPHLLSTDYKTLLAFLTSTPDPDWDGTYVNIKSPGDPHPERLALVEFRHCMSARLGAPNEEVLSGHPLSGRGLEHYTAQIVVNLRWIEALRAIDSVHTHYKPDVWNRLNHYVFWFHDTTFECVAESYGVEVFNESFGELLARMCSRVLST